MTFDEKITEIMRNIGIAENTLMAVQLELDAYEARATAAEAENAKLREALVNIKYEAERENGSWLHLKRCIAVQARAALETDNG
jgi:hypothetical protein